MLFVYGYHKINNTIKTTLQVQQKIFSQRPRHKERAVLSVLRGSMTVEASLIMPIFLIVICGIARFFVLINFQNILQEDMENAAGYLGCIQYIEEDNSKISQSFAYVKIMAGKAGSIADKAGIKGGRYGISMMQSDISPDNDMNKMVVDYSWSVSTFQGGSKLNLRLVQKCSYIPWIGKSIVKKDKSKDEDIVYITKNGIVYHTSRECTYLTRCNRNVRYSEIVNMRNIGGGKYKGCERCIKGKLLDSDIVYITDYGDRFHSKKDCNTLKRYIQEIKLSEVEGRKLCSKCGKKMQESKGVN